MEYSPVLILLNLAAAAALLIWSVRLVRTGFERAFGGHLRQSLRHSTKNRFAAAVTGAVAAVLLQSSTAVALLLAGFMTAGTIGTTSGLAIILGADLGSAIVVQLLTSPLAMLTPLLLLLGVMFFLRSSRRDLRQIGRILIGLALIFMSLDLIREATGGGPHAVIDFVGMPATSQLGRDAMRKGGTQVQVGLYGGQLDFDIGVVAEAFAEEGGTYTVLIIPYAASTLAYDLAVLVE